MNDIRARFEEIWPVPEGVCWSPVFGAYVCAHGSPVKLECMELNLRLDTFTRCQETMGPVLSLVDEMVAEIEKWIEIADPDCGDPECSDCSTWVKTRDIVGRAKQIMEQQK